MITKALIIADPWIGYRGHWAVFWRVRDPIELPQDQRLLISAVQTIKGGWRKDAPPRGPELVATPSIIEFSL